MIEAATKSCKYNMTYCLCVSNDLGYVVLEYLHKHGLPINLVLTDSGSTEILEYCDSNDIVVFKGNPRKGRASAFIEDNEIQFDVLLSVNYLFIIESDLINQAKRYPINIHGSKLPLYRGRCPNVWAIINGEVEEGITAHLIAEGCDEGDIVKQSVFPITPEHTGYDLLSRSFDIYPKWTLDLISDIEHGNISLTPQDMSKATFFGKRTPEDGLINWNWQKERIRNWVRAQAQPYYPGAFTNLNSEKIIINSIKYSDYGYSWDMPNGLVISLNDGNPLVKTPNGVVELTSYISENTININDFLK